MSKLSFYAPFFIVWHISENQRRMKMIISGKYQACISGWGISFQNIFLLFLDFFIYSFLHYVIIWVKFLGPNPPCYDFYPLFSSAQHVTTWQCSFFSLQLPYFSSNVRFWNSFENIFFSVELFIWIVQVLIDSDKEIIMTQ